MGRDDGGHRRIAVLFAAAALAMGARVEAQDGPPTLSGARVTAQVVGGTLVAPAAFIGGGVLTKRVALRMGASEQGAGQAAYVAAYATTWLTTSAVPAVVGREGKFPAALGGSALGMVAAAGLVRVGNWLYDDDRRTCGVLCWTLGAAVVALPSVGATVLYNESRR